MFVKNKSTNQGLMSMDRKDRATLPFTIPSSLLCAGASPQTAPAPHTALVWAVDFRDLA